MTEQKFSFESTDLLAFVWKKRKIFIILGVTAAIVSSIVSLLMEEKFRSTVTIYPSKSSGVVYNEVTTEDYDAAKFGEEDEAEQMLQIMESSKIREKVVAKFKLMEHYEIDPESELCEYELGETYKDQITFSRNSKGAVIIDVLDKNPDTAMAIATYISDLFDSTKNDIIHEKVFPEYLIKKQDRQNLIQRKQAIRDTMSKLSQLGAVTQDGFEALTTQYTMAKNAEEKEELKRKIEMTEKYGFVLRSYEMELEFLEDRLATLESVFLKTKTDAFEDMRHRFEIEPATKPYRKAYPVRWLIVTVSTFSTVFMAFVLLLFWEKIKELRQLED